MRAHEIMTDTPLYHFTTFVGAKGILNDGFIDSSGFRDQYVSATRDQRLSFYQNVIRFDLDTRRLKTKFKIVPYNFWPNGPSSRSESEERIMAHTIPLTFVKSITLLPPKAPRGIEEIQRRTGDEIATKAKELGIPVIDKR